MSFGRGRRALAVTLAALHWASARPCSAQANAAGEGTQPGGLDAAAPPADIASECSSCHSGSRDDNGQLFRPFDTWAGTMMANAMRDPLFLAALTVAEQDVPGSGSYCLRCHTPKGFVKGNASGTGAALDADDLQGVECEACHRSIDGSLAQPELLHDGSLVAPLPIVDPASPYLGNARLIWDPRDVRHGPHTDADSPAHAAAGNSFNSSSEFCGQCHEVMSPTRQLIDSTGRDTSLPFPLDSTYSEWKSSAFARAGATFRTCIDCHMQPAVAIGATTASFPSALARDNPRTHLLVGGSEWSIEAVMQANPLLALERAESFELAKSATRDLLATAVDLHLEASPVNAGATRIDAVVRVTNHAGHKFPSGYADGRRAFLQVELIDSQGQSLGLIGKYDAATQQLVPEPGLRVWETIQAEHLPDGSHREWHLVKNDVILKDTRIPPAGFHPLGSAAITTAPVGADYGASGELRNDDQVAVHFEALPALGPGQLTLVARVFYQSTMREFVEELERANVTDQRGSALRSVWENTGRSAPRLIKSSSLKLEPTTVQPAAGGSGGATAGSAGSAPTQAGTNAQGGAASSMNREPASCSCRLQPVSAKRLQWSALLLAALAYGRRRRLGQRDRR